jgi:hypothetical protein
MSFETANTQGGLIPGTDSTGFDNLWYSYSENVVDDTVEGWKTQAPYLMELLLGNHINSVGNGGRNMVGGLVGENKIHPEIVKYVAKLGAMHSNFDEQYNMLIKYISDKDMDSYKKISIALSNLTLSDLNYFTFKNIWESEKGLSDLKIELSENKIKAFLHNIDTFKLNNLDEIVQLNDLLKRDILENNYNNIIVKPNYITSYSKYVYYTLIGITKIFIEDSKSPKDIIAEHTKFLTNQGGGIDPNNIFFNNNQIKNYLTEYSTLTKFTKDFLRENMNIKILISPNNFITQQFTDNDVTNILRTIDFNNVIVKLNFKKTEKSNIYSLSIIEKFIPLIEPKKNSIYITNNGNSLQPINEENILRHIYEQSYAYAILYRQIEKKFPDTIRFKISNDIFNIDIKDVNIKFDIANFFTKTLKLKVNFVNSMQKYSFPSLFSSTGQIIMENDWVQKGDKIMKKNTNIEFDNKKEDASIYCDINNVKCQHFISQCLINDDEKGLNHCLDFFEKQDFFTVATNEMKDYPAAAIKILKLFQIIDSNNNLSSVDAWLMTARGMKIKTYVDNRKLVSYLKGVHAYLIANPLLLKGITKVDETKRFVLTRTPFASTQQLPSSRANDFSIAVQKIDMYKPVTSVSGIITENPIQPTLNNIPSSFGMGMGMGMGMGIKLQGGGGLNGHIKSDNAVQTLRILVSNAVMELKNAGFELKTEDKVKIESLLNNYVNQYNDFIKFINLKDVLVATGKELQIISPHVGPQEISLDEIKNLETSPNTIKLIEFLKTQKFQIVNCIQQTQNYLGETESSLLTLINSILKPGK